MMFSDWLEVQIGPCKWMVGRSNKKRRAEGYDCFFTRKRFDALKKAHEKEFAEMSDQDHLTEPNSDLADKRRKTPPGMAFWSGTGPEKATCRGCRFWNSEGYLASSDLLRDSSCDKYRSMMHGVTGPRLPHWIAACKYFEPVEKDRPLSKPKTRNPS